MAFFSLVFLALAPRASHAAIVTFAWDPSAEAELAGYRLHYGHASRTYTTSIDAADEDLTDEVITKSVDLTDPSPYYIAVTAYDRNGNESGYSNEVIYIPPEPESVSTPSPPSGPTTLQAGVSYVFTAGGAASSTGDAIQYCFFWSDGTDSGWLPAGAIEVDKSWALAGTYTEVRVQARCATHTSVVSALSDPITVTVEDAPAETVGQPTTLTGPTTVTTLSSQTYTAGGASSTSGHPVQYRFLWADGTVSPWLPAGRLEATRTWSFPGTYAVRVEARCELHTAVHSPPSVPLDVLVDSAPGEAITAPGAPAGPADGRTGFVYGYAAGGATSTTGDPLQYRFQWGDGTASPWLAPGSTGTARAWKSWPNEGMYTVAVEARCALHPSVPATAETAVSIAGGDSLLLADSFSDGTAAGDPQWRTLSGRWLVGADKTFASASLKAANRAVVRALPAYTAGRLSTRLMLTRGSLLKSTGLVFALADAQHYRYVTVSGSRITLGQVGDIAGERAGVKAAAARTFRAGTWYRLRVDIRPGGRVQVFVDNAKTPLLTHRFASAVAGSVGCLAQQSVAHFDDFRVWDVRALP
ncbi:MAG TPA: hypothetical protein VN317_07860 [Candidatus Methanoperedens sp.]|nr:hypothetical protein [Candidatus Methanoperedens sp.]